MPPSSPDPVDPSLSLFVLLPEPVPKRSLLSDTLPETLFQCSMSLNIKGRSINGVFYRAEIGNRCGIDISIIGYADFYGKFLSGANSPDTLLKKRQFFCPL
jgi:hypothetical protein